MKNGYRRTILLAPICLSLLLSGCGGVKLWPFGGDSAQERPRIPPNATEFQCNAGKRFYLRYLDNGAAAWLILGEREVRLNKVASASGTRYSTGSAVLDVNGNEAALADGSVSYTGCKTAAQ